MVPHSLQDKIHSLDSRPRHLAWPGPSLSLILLLYKIREIRSPLTWDLIKRLQSVGRGRSLDRSALRRQERTCPWCSVWGVKATMLSLGTAPPCEMPRCHHSPGGLPGTLRPRRKGGTGPALGPAAHCCYWAAPSLCMATAGGTIPKSLLDPLPPRARGRTFSERRRAPQKAGRNLPFPRGSSHLESGQTLPHRASGEWTRLCPQSGVTLPRLECGAPCIPSGSRSRNRWLSPISSWQRPHREGNTLTE